MNLHAERLKMGMGLDRRVRWIRRWFWGIQDDFGEIIAVLLGLGLFLLICSVGWFVLDKIERFFR